MLTKLIIICILIVLLAGLYFFLPYRAINKNKSDNYYFDFFKTKVHYIPMGNSFELGNTRMDSVDIKSVEVIGSNYLKDKSHVYFKATRINNADCASFEILCANNGSFAKDKNMIYFQGHSFKGIDVSSFKFAGEACGPILIDKNYVYSTYCITYNTDENFIIPPIQNTTPQEYQYLNDLYGKDDKVAYYKGSPITGSDMKTFILLGNYAKDENHVYFDGLQVNDLDPATFKIIDGGGYIKDKNGVYFGLNSIDDAYGNPVQYSGKIITGADPETFVMVKGEKIDYAKDRSKYYWGERYSKFKAANTTI